jgi:hypothetical protein
MAYQVDKFNGTFLVAVADGTVDTTTDLRLLGKNYAGYGEVQNENFLHLLENFANTSPPPKAINGQVWFDSASKRLKFYDADNTKWRTTGGLEVSSTAPVKMNVGDFWYDTSADQLYSWNGNAFVLIGPQPTVGGSQTATSVAIVKGTDGINYNIVKFLAGAGDTVAIVANDAFTLDNILNPISGFSNVKKGITLVNTDSAGITTTDNIFWGTASNSEKLGGVLASEFVQKGASAFTSQVAFTNAGYTVGTPGNNLAVFIELGDQPVIESRGSARVTVRIRESVSVAHDIMEFIAPTTNPGAAIPGITSTFDLGTPINKWKNVYADDFVGRLTGNVTGNTTGNHKGNVTASDDSTAYNSTTKEFTGAFSGILTGNVIGDVTGSSSNAFTLNNLQGSVATVNSTVVIRDSLGNINANSFIGTSSRADQLLVPGSGYRSATTAPTANTVVVRDSNGSISVNLLNGTATAANTLQANGAGYVTASTTAVGNTIVVRDSAGNIQVNGIIGSATSAAQLQVDSGSFRLASTSAIANTIVSRDSDGVIRATSIQNTPIGTTTRAAGAFTTLAANGAVTFTQGTASTSTTTGTLVISGGLGVSGLINSTGVVATTVTATTLNSTTISATGTSVLRKATAASTVNDASYSNAAIEVRELNYAGAGAGTVSEAPRIGLHWSSRVASQIGLEPSGRIAILNNPGTAYEALVCGNLTSAQISGSAITVSGAVTSNSVSTQTFATATFTATSIVAGSITETSSAIYKENINPLEDALNSILKLVGVSYDRIDTKAHEVGLIAEDVEKIIPDIVSKNQDGEPIGIQYTKLTAYLIESIKSLKKEIDLLKNQK